MRSKPDGTLCPKKEFSESATETGMPMPANAINANALAVRLDPPGGEKTVSLQRASEATITRTAIPDPANKAGSRPRLQ